MRTIDLDEIDDKVQEVLDKYPTREGMAISWVASMRGISDRFTAMQREVRGSRWRFGFAVFAWLCSSIAYLLVRFG